MNTEWFAKNSHTVVFQQTIPLQNRSLRFHIAPPWELQFGNKPHADSPFFVKVRTENDLRHIQIERLP